MNCIRIFKLLLIVVTIYNVFAFISLYERGLFVNEAGSLLAINIGMVMLVFLADKLRRN